MSTHSHRATSIGRRLKAHLQDFRRAKPGERFQQRYRRRRRLGHGILAKALSLGTGVVLFVLGLILIPPPGPGLLVVFVGAGLIAEESYLAARAFDSLELRARRVATRALRAWKRASAAARVLVMLIVACSAAASALAAFAFVSR
jgi:uncharacterized protein (TIGR02611 family)